MRRERGEMGIPTSLKYGEGAQFKSSRKMRRTSMLSFVGGGKSTSSDGSDNVNASPKGESRKVLLAFSEKIKKQVCSRNLNS